MGTRRFLVALTLAGALAQSAPALALLASPGPDPGVNWAPGFAFPLDAYFDLSADGDIFEATTVPHASVSGTFEDADDEFWYSFRARRGSRAFFDIDYGWDDQDGAVDTVLALFVVPDGRDLTGTLVAFGDDASDATGAPDPGTVLAFNAVALDAFIGELVLPVTGRYYLAVTGYGLLPRALDQGVSRRRLTMPGFTDGGGFSGESVSGATPDDGYRDSGAYESGGFVLHASVAAPLAVPEPATLGLMAAGLAAMAYRRRRGALNR
jgi:hypothetical protein